MCILPLRRRMPEIQLLPIGSTNPPITEVFTCVQRNDRFGGEEPVVKGGQ